MDIMNNNFIREVKLDKRKIPSNSYLKKIDCIMSLKALEFTKNITFFVGENGSGKTTLLRAIAKQYGFNPEGGTLNYNFSTYDEDDELFSIITLVKGYRRPKNHASYYFRADSFYNVASMADEYEVFYGDDIRSLHAMSHGQSFQTFLENFKEPGLYILDEPESALSPKNQLKLLIQIMDMAEKGAQFIIATHSPILLAATDADIVSFDLNDLRHIQYKDTESFKLMSEFIANPNSFVNKIKKEDLSNDKVRRGIYL